MFTRSQGDFGVMGVNIVVVGGIYSFLDFEVWVKDFKVFDLRFGFIVTKLYRL